MRRKTFGESEKVPFFLLLKNPFISKDGLSANLSRPYPALRAPLPLEGELEATAIVLAYRTQWLAAANLLPIAFSLFPKKSYLRGLKIPTER